MPIFRRTRLCTTAYGVVHWLWWLWLAVVVWSCVVSCVHCVKVTVLLKMCIMMPETCWDRSLTINNRLIASCWFLSLHPVIAIITLPDAFQNLKEKDCPGRYQSHCPYLQTSALTLQPYMSSASSTPDHSRLFCLWWSDTCIIGPVYLQTEVHKQQTNAT